MYLHVCFSEITEDINIYDGLRAKMIEHAHVVSVALHKAYHEDHPSIAYEHLLVSLNKVCILCQILCSALDMSFHFFTAHVDK